mgnify:CR=1 FL=1
MKLSKYFALALCALSFTGSSADDDNDARPDDVPGFYAGKTVLVLNNGNMSGNIPGSLSSIDMATGTVTNNVFREANGRVLGDTPQGAIIHGSKLYVAVTQSDIIEVVNPVTMKSIQTIKPTGEGSSPRSLTAKDGYVYVTMFDGYVARIDTLSLSIDKTLKLGPCPEELGIAGNYLYVAVSDGYNTSNNCVDGYVSKINIPTFTEEAKIDAGINTNKLVTNGREVFVICTGNYKDVNPTLKRIKSDNSVEPLFEAALMAINGNTLYTINDPYATPTYWAYDIASGKKTELKLDKLITPTAIGVNPATNNIFVASYSIPFGYKEPCIVNEYTASGSFVDQYNVGIGAGCFVF